MQHSSGSLYRRIILIPLLLLSIFGISGFVLIDLYLSNATLGRYENDLQRLALSGSQLLEFVDSGADSAEFDNFADRFSKDNHFRTTIISDTGVVLGDSQLSLREVQAIENHAERPEIQEARESGVGMSQRYSTTLKTDLLYVAIRYNNNGEHGYFRVSLPLIDLEQENFKRRMAFANFLLISLLIAAFLSVLSSNHLIATINQGKAALERRLSKRTKEIEMLQNLGTQLTACNSREEALEVIRLITSLLLPDVTGTLALFRSSRDKMEIATSWNGDSTAQCDYSPDQCWALRTGKAHHGNPSIGNITCSHSHDENQQMMCIPLIAQGETHGVFHLASPITKAWTSEEQQLASAVAEHASLTLASLAMRESLRQQAIKDTLTGLYNRRYLLEVIEHELSRATRRDLSMGLLMIDIDHFKNVNDEHGHDTGDFILSEFGRLLRLLLRDEDVACRYGGEEFTVLLPDTDKTSTLNVAEKISHRIREHDFMFNNRSYGPVTISIGVSMFPENGIHAEQLIKSADAALYEAKHQGRDRVVLSGMTPLSFTAMEENSPEPEIQK